MRPGRKHKYTRGVLAEKGGHSLMRTGNVEGVVSAQSRAICGRQAGNGRTHGGNCRTRGSPGRSALNGTFMAVYAQNGCSPPLYGSTAIRTSTFSRS